MTSEEEQNKSKQVDQNHKQIREPRPRVRRTVCLKDGAVVYFQYNKGTGRTYMVYEHKDEKVPSADGKGTRNKRCYAGIVTDGLPIADEHKRGQQQGEQNKPPKQSRQKHRNNKHKRKQPILFECPKCHKPATNKFIDKKGGLDIWHRNEGSVRDSKDKDGHLKRHYRRCHIAKERLQEQEQPKQLKLDHQSVKTEQNPDHQAIVQNYEEQIEHYKQIIECQRRVIQKFVFNGNGESK